MRPTIRSVRRPFAAVAAAALLLAACNGDDDATPDGGGDAGAAEDGGEGSIAQNYDLSGASFHVGTKDFAEQYIIAQILVQALEAAGADVEYTQDLASPDGARNALLAGEVDLAWEYTGTAWINYLGNDEPLDDPMEQYEATAEQDLEENGVVWSEPAPFDNTYGFAMSREAYEEYGLDTVSDLAAWVEENPDQATLCADATFPTRDDGLPRIEEVYDFQWPTDVIIGNMDFGVIYQSIAERDPCEIGEIFTTDGRILALDLQVLEDDQNGFISYLSAVQMMEATADEYPELLDLIAELGAPIDEELMTEMNAAVDVDGEFPEDVAEQYLRDQGFI
ncbi:glycine betaine ABC transporter substrate-binding protein [Egicoccus sp. AB-alg2]|uniref:glycine betaine ABC transporter substrate-binding protein n=1 Tax=Egicoccus sp. AB-alg2 TaxID=3242693 RepID=UPI00359EF5B2